MPRSVADLDKLTAAATFLLTERGYLVIGTEWAEHPIGEVIFVLWNVAIEYPLRIITETTRQDWIEQARCANAAFPNEFKKTFYKKSGDHATDDMLGHFYRVITD